MLFTTTPGQHLGVVMNLNLILKIADMERDRPYKHKRIPQILRSVGGVSGGNLTCPETHIVKNQSWCAVMAHIFHAWLRKDLRGRGIASYKRVTRSWNKFSTSSRFFPLSFL